MNGAGSPGRVTMHDPPAVGAVIDRGVVRTREMRVDVETGGVHRRIDGRARRVPPFEERDRPISSLPNLRVLGKILLPTVRSRKHARTEDGRATGAAAASGFSPEV